jgi:hypothetical protein
MLNTDKVKGIMRAKQGSQVPKLWGGNSISGPGGVMNDGNTPLYDPSLE